MADCRSCGAPIRWVVTLKGKHLPLNREPYPVRGNVRREQHGAEVRAHVLHDQEAADARAAGELLWLAHFATCPNADTHRRDG